MRRTIVAKAGVSNTANIFLRSRRKMEEGSEATVVFSSLVFIFAFLALNLVIYYFAPNKMKNVVLLVFSLIFYTWAAPPYVLILLGETAASWFLALRIEKAEGQSAKKKYLIAECVILLGLLGCFKYAGFFAANFQALFGVPEILPNIILPVGISFYTFQLISYVVDVYRGEVSAQPAYWKLLLYSSLFYQCIAGPIIRYETVADEIEHRKPSGTDIYEGVRRFSIGLAKKAILANSCALVADTLLPVGDMATLSLQSTEGMWIGMLFYAFHIYFDFSAYSDMAIGMGRMVGFHFLENFNYPYVASSVQGFWRRWHISLSSFFRDYVYIPLGGSRCSTGKYIRNMCIVWLLTGFWHGASWNYVLWGAWFLGFLLLERFVIRDRMPKPIGHIYTLLVVLFSWTLFRFENFSELGTVFSGLFGLAGGGIASMQASTMFTQNIFLLIFCVIACTSLGKRLRTKISEKSIKSDRIFKVYSIGEAVLPIALVILSVIFLAGNSYNPFIYFQF